MACIYAPLFLFTQSNQSYNAPLHTDDKRMERILSMSGIIDELFKNYAHEKNYPSLAYGILLDGKLILHGQSGNIQDGIAADKSSMYRIASMSKSVTAVCILQLRDAGKLRLDDPAHLYIPALKTNTLLTKDAPAITIRHLLNHAAGFPEDNPWGDRQLADTKDELMNLIKSGTHFSDVPGITFEYSNLGFALLGQIVEKVSGQSLEVYSKQKIFIPLGMNHTEWEYTKVPAAKLAYGYRYEDNKYKKEELLHHGTYGAMGGLITSIEDFAKYVALHMSAWPPRSDAENKVLRRSSLREMHMPANFSGMNPNYKYPSGRSCGIVSAYNYGLGWMRDCDGRVYIGHSGGLPGFGSQWRILPEYGLGVISFANLTYAGTGGINLKVLDTIIQSARLKPYELPVSNILAQRKNELIRLFPDWKENDVTSYSSGKSKIFAENFFPDRSAESWRK
jgi:CubicO group peptidase (beta-lactamase class C family)